MLHIWQVVLRPQGRSSPPPAPVTRSQPPPARTAPRRFVRAAPETRANSSAYAPVQSEKAPEGGLSDPDGLGSPSGSYREREKGFEPSTSTLARLHSTTELLPRGGAPLYDSEVGVSTPLFRVKRFRGVERTDGQEWWGFGSLGLAAGGFRARRHPRRCPHGQAGLSRYLLGGDVRRRGARSPWRSVAVAQGAGPQLSQRRRA